LDAGDQLAIRQPWRRLAGDETTPAVDRIAPEQLSLEALVNGPGSQDRQVVIRLQDVFDLHDESVQVLEPAWFPGGLRGTTASVANGGLMPNVARRSVVRRHL
jgi:hypothetical protein